MKSNENPMLRLENLSFGFEKTKPILSDISFTIEKGSFTLITGPNGSGKSLLLKCIKGLLKPTS
ncbi:MAG: ABC transporter ATP-binding protein, partial [Sphaerochaeta sp.]|nr:ABC transporter ATP-binding protein [Sphaerochaeta sp.]